MLCTFKKYMPCEGRNILLRGVVDGHDGVSVPPAARHEGGAHQAGRQSVARALVPEEGRSYSKEKSEQLGNSIEIMKKHARITRHVSMVHRLDILNCWKIDTQIQIIVV